MVCSLFPYSGMFSSSTFQMIIFSRNFILHVQGNLAFVCYIFIEDRLKSFKMVQQVHVHLKVQDMLRCDLTIVKVTQYNYYAST